MFDKIKNYKLHEDTIKILYGSIISVSFIIVNELYKKLIK
jgi:hypothetical protein